MDNLNFRGSFGGSGGDDDDDDYDDYDGSEQGDQFGSEELSEELSEDFLSQDEDFVDDSMNEGDLEPTDFSESSHISDLEEDDLPAEPMPEPVETPDEDGKNGMMGAAAIGGAAALGVGALGAVLLASKKFSDFLSKDDDDNDGAVDAVYRLQDSMPSQSSSSNVAGPAPV